MATDTLKPGSLGGLSVVKVQEKQPHLNMMIYGDSGIGKTTLAGSADAVPSMRPAVVIDIEGGTESLRSAYPDIDVVRVQSWTDMQKVYDELHRGQTKYQTVILDSLTEIQKFSMYEIMADLIKQKPDMDPDVPGMREWGKNVEQIRRFVRGFRDLPMNSIFTALTKQDSDPRTGLKKTLPSLSGKVAQEVPAFLDLVLYYYVKRVDGKEQRLLLSSPTETQIAKDRTSRLPQVMEDPTMKKIYGFINGDAEKNIATPTPTATKVASTEKSK